MIAHHYGMFAFNTVEPAEIDHALISLGADEVGRDAIAALDPD